MIVQVPVTTMAAYIWLRRLRYNISRRPYHDDGFNEKFSNDIVFFHISHSCEYSVTNSQFSNYLSIILMSFVL